MYITQKLYHKIYITDAVKRKSEALWNQRFNKLACLLAVAVIVIAFLVAIVIYQLVSITKDEKKKVKIIR